MCVGHSMIKRNRQEKPISVLLLDTGKEWGGGTNSMLEWLRRRDREQFKVTCVFYHNYQRGRGGETIENVIRTAGAEFVLLPQRAQPGWAKLSKELLRGILHAAPSMRARSVERIELAWRIRPAAQQLAKLIKAHRPDLVYMNNQPASNYEGYLAAAMANVPVVQHCRTEPKFSRRVAELVNRSSARVLAVSNSVGQALQKQGVGKDKVRVIFNGIDLNQNLPAAEDLAQRLDIPAGTPTVAVVGSLIKRKRVEDAISALARIPMPAHLLVLGEGREHQALQALAQTLGVAGRVHFLGFIPHPLSWVSACDAVVLASESEGMPRVLLEAMLLGKPIIASDVPGSRDVVAQGETGWLYPYRDVERLAEYLGATLGASDRGRAMGEAGRKRVYAEFGIDRYVAEVSQALAEAAHA